MQKSSSDINPLGDQDDAQYLSIFVNIYEYIMCILNEWYCAHRIGTQQQHPQTCQKSSSTRTNQNHAQMRNRTTKDMLNPAPCMFLAISRQTKNVKIQSQNQTEREALPNDTQTASLGPNPQNKKIQTDPQPRRNISDVCASVNVTMGVIIETQQHCSCINT